MLWTIITILAVLWLVGMLTANLAGGLLHILIIAAVVLFIYNMVVGRRGPAV